MLYSHVVSHIMKTQGKTLVKNNVQTLWVTHCSFSPIMKNNRNNRLSRFQRSSILRVEWQEALIYSQKNISLFHWDQKSRCLKEKRT